MPRVPGVLKVGETYRFIFSATTVRATVNEIDPEIGWIAVSVKGVGDYWMNLATVAGVQTEAEAQKVEAERARSQGEKKNQGR